MGALPVRVPIYSLMNQTCITVSTLLAERLRLTFFEDMEFYLKVVQTGK